MEQSTFLSADNKTDVVYYIFDDVKQPKAILQISHGMQEHILRYGDLIKFLNKKGIIVCGNDDLGHGQTSKSSETDGHFADKDGAKYVLQDLHTTTLLVKQKYPKLPYFLLGHSMGSFYARNYAYVYPNEVSGLILCGTSGKVAGTNFAIMLLSFMKTIGGKKGKFRFLEDIMLKSYFKYIDNVKTRREWVSRNEEKMAEYMADPKCQFKFTVSAYQDMLKTLKFVNTEKWAKGIDCELPILLCSGSKDPVGNYGKGVCNVYKLLEKQNIKDLQIKLYSDARHELQNELKETQNEFFEDINNWITQRI